MYLHEFLASCRRRWALVLVLIAASATLCVLAAGAIPPKYDAEASLVLIPPRPADDPLANRYLDLGSLSNTVDVLARSMTSADTAELLEESVPGAEYDVSHDLTTSAPIVLVSATSDTSEATTLMLNAVMAQLPRTLELLQAEVGVEPKSLITSIALSIEKAQVNNKSRVRVIAVVAVALLFASGVALAVIDGLLLRRSRRRDTTEGGDGDSDGLLDRASDVTRSRARPLAGQGEAAEKERVSAH